MMKMELKEEFLCRRASPKGERDEPVGGGRRPPSACMDKKVPSEKQVFRLIILHSYIRLFSDKAHAAKKSD